MLALILGLTLAPAGTAAEPRERSVTVAILPAGTALTELDAADERLAVGILSGGLGSVSAQQSLLDIGQGNRLLNSLYDRDLPALYVLEGRVPPRRWQRAARRARDAPAQLQPGLLGSELSQAGVPLSADRLAGQAALIAADREGAVGYRECRPRCAGLHVRGATLRQLPALADQLGPDDLLIALERPTRKTRLLSVALAGAGFGGEAAPTSATTRTDGYVASTDLAPTILEAFGLPVPVPVSGRAIEPGGTATVGALEQRRERMGEITGRRGPVIGTNLVVWIGLALLAGLVGGRRAGALAATTLAIAIAIVPALLLLAAALTPSELTERLLIGIGAPLAAIAAFAVMRPSFGPRAGLAAFALAAAITALVTAVDVIAGSTYTALSLVGSNPGLGVRFYGVGNELEAIFGALLVLGPAAALAARPPANPGRALALAVTVVVVVGVAAFAPGRFGADVGAAITFPAGAAGAVIAGLGATRSRAVLIVAAPLAALLALVAVDLVIGGDAHLSRSVLDAGGLDGLGEVAERRVRLGASSFERFIDSPHFLAAILLLVAGVVWRDRVWGWLGASPPARAGVAGALTATVIGTLANDSGALLLMVGTAYIAAFALLCAAVIELAEEADSG